MVFMKARLHFYQDGKDFYCSETGNLIASFPIVKDDYDTKGAKIARILFIQQYGDEYKPETC